MAENKVKDGNYIMIQSFMVKDLKLKGNELLVYAIIYGFSQEENCVFSGSLQYLADWTNSTKQGIMKCLKSLEEKDLIVKQSLMVNKVVYSTKFNTSSKQSLTDSVKQSLPNNIDKDNIINNKDTKNAIINAKITNEDLKATLYEFIKMRKLIKKPMTDRALELLIKKLHSLAKNPEMAIKILEQSIVNGWQDVYALKEQDKNKVITHNYTKQQHDSVFVNLDEVEI